MPPSLWLAAYGDYCNGAAGKPLLVSLLVYLDPHWQRDWDAETLFLDDSSGVGLLIQPRPARAVLMHADVLHRVSTPSLAARRPRYSLVLKLALVPRVATEPDQAAGDQAAGDPAAGGEAKPQKGPGAAAQSVCRPEWGTPVRIG